MAIKAFAQDFVWTSSASVFKQTVLWLILWLSLSIDVLSFSKSLPTAVYKFVCSTLPQTWVAVSDVVRRGWTGVHLGNSKSLKCSGYSTHAHQMYTA